MHFRSSSPPPSASEVWQGCLWRAASGPTRATSPTRTPPSGVSSMSLCRHRALCGSAGIRRPRGRGDRLYARRHRADAFAGAHARSAGADCLSAASVVRHHRTVLRAGQGPRRSAAGDRELPHRDCRPAALCPDLGGSGHGPFRDLGASAGRFRHWRNPDLAVAGAGAGGGVRRGLPADPAGAGCPPFLAGAAAHIALTPARRRR